MGFEIRETCPLKTNGLLARPGNNRRGHEIDTRGDLHTGHEAWAWGGLVGESGIDDGDEGAVQEEDGVHRGIRVLQMRGGGMVTYQ